MCLPAEVSGTDLTVTYTFADGSTYTEKKTPSKDFTTGNTIRISTEIAKEDLAEKCDIIVREDGSMAKKDDDEEKGYDLGGDNCIEVVKERENGLQDLFIPLWYEKQTRRLKNSPLEKVVYGWDFDGFIGRQADEIPPF